MSAASEEPQQPPATEMAEQTVVIALDASEQAAHAVNWYLEKVHRPGNKVVFVHVIELPELKLNQARSLHMSPGVLASMWKEEEQKTKALEEKMKGIMKDKGIEGVLRTATGKPGETICRIADEENAAMIVTGTRGMGKVRRTILGSVSDYLVHHACMPVIVCQHPSSYRSRRASGEGKKSRHASGSSLSGASDSERQRHPSGENGKQRHFSGDSIFAALSRKLSSDKMKVRSQSVGSEDD